MTAGFEFYAIKHHLKDIGNLTDVALSQISDESIEEYDAEYTEMREAYRNDASTIADLKHEAREKLVEIFGSMSKQVKYMDRNLRSERTAVDIHYDKFPSLHTVKERINCAKEKVSDSGSRAVSETKVGRAGVNEQEMEEVDASIRYLISKGYTYGVDFNSHNAVEISQCSAIEVVEKMISDEDDAFDELLTTTFTCCKEIDKDSSQVQTGGDVSVWCGCGDNRVEYSVELNDAKISLVKIEDE